MLYKYHVADHEAIESSFLVIELDAMNVEFKSKTNHSLFLKSDNRKTKVHKLWLKFGKSELPSEGINLQRRVSKLKHLAHKIVCSGQVPRSVIACTVARIEHNLKYNDWRMSLTIPLDMYIDHKNENFELFSFLEYSQEKESVRTKNFGSSPYFN